MANIIDGRAIAHRIEKDAQADLSRLRQEGHEPRLVSVRVGEDPASELYVRHQERVFKRAEVAFEELVLPGQLTEAELNARLTELSDDPKVNGIMLQMPLPDAINPRRARRRIHPDKDVEGIHPQALGYLLSGRPTLVPCTAAAALACLDDTGLEFRGKRAVVVGHSETVGKPIALLLTDRLATVTICHHGTLDLAAHTREAEILVVAVGKAGLITPNMVAEGAAVIDIGINEVEGENRVVGDVEVAVADKAAHFTPVPGGVGPITVAKLLHNTAVAMERQIRED